MSKIVEISQTQKDLEAKILQNMNSMSREAEKNGLIEERLAEILEEIDRERDNDRPSSYK